jgi:hypothetical protein
VDFIMSLEPGEFSLRQHVRREGFTPDTKDFETQGLELGHHSINISVVGEEANPVRIGSCKVVG